MIVNTWPDLLHTLKEGWHNRDEVNEFKGAALTFKNLFECNNCILMCSKSVYLV